jgi:hypothetical protein
VSNPTPLGTFSVAPLIIQNLSLFVARDPDAHLSGSWTDRLPTAR